MSDRTDAAIDSETRTFTIFQLLDEVRRGRVRLPSFVRGFVFSDEARLRLLDSLKRGYPIGALLLARGPAPAGHVSLAGFHQEVSAVVDALWLVDGQQRLATLAMALIEDHSGGYRPLFFDPQSGQFVLSPRRHAPPPEWIPTQVLLSSAALNRWLREANLSEVLNDRADQIAARLREYQVPAYLIHYDGRDDGALRDIFERTNNVGHGGQSEGVEPIQDAIGRFKEAVPIARIRANLAPLGFGALEGSEIELAALAVTGTTLDQPFDDLIEAWASNGARLSQEVTEGLSRAIAFLREDVGILHAVLLLNGDMLAILARFFALHPSPHPRNRDLLGRWLWRGMLSFAYQTDGTTDDSAWSATGDRAAAAALTINQDEHSAVQRLLRLLPSLTAAEIPTQLGVFHRSAAQTRIELIALAAMDPRLLTGAEVGAPVPLAALLNEDPPEVLAPFIILPDAERTLAEILLHPRITPEEFFAAPPALLRSHGIDEAALAALRQGDTVDFLRLRSALLTDHVTRFLRERAALDPPDRDRAPLDAYFSEEGP